MGEFFEEIEILEGVYLPDKETLIQRDWSDFFETTYGKGSFIKNNGTLQGEKNIQQIFLEKLLQKLNNKFKSLSEYYCVIDAGEKFLNKRVFHLKSTSKEEVKTFITNFYNSYMDENCIKVENRFTIDFTIDGNLTLERCFNPKIFFSNHESLLDITNDFLKNEKIFLGLKKKEKGKKVYINTLEDQIKKLPGEYLFYVTANLKEIENQKLVFKGYKKYENMFILERGDYICHKKII